MAALNKKELLSAFSQKNRTADSVSSDHKKIQKFLFRESIAVSSLLNKSPLLFADDELELLKESSSILYAYQTLYPKDVEGFWLVESLGRFILREVKKPRKINDIEKRLKIIHVPFPIFISDERKEKITESIKYLSYFYAEDVVSSLLSTFSECISILDRLEKRIYPNMINYFSGGSRQETYRNATLTAYREILSFLSTSTKRFSFNILSEQMSLSAVLDDVSRRLFTLEENIDIDEETAHEFLSNYGVPERSLMWLYEETEKTNNDLSSSVSEVTAKERVYSPVGFGEMDLRVGDIVSVPLSDFYLNFVLPTRLPTFPELENSKRVLPYIFFFKYNNQSKMGFTSIVGKSKEFDELIKAFSENMVTGRKDDNEPLNNTLLTFGKLVEMNAKFIAQSIKIDFTNRLTMLFSHKDFLAKEKPEQLLYIMGSLRQILSEKKHLIPAIQDNYFAKIRIEKLSELLTENLSEGFRLYYNTVNIKKTENVEDDKKTIVVNENKMIDEKKENDSSENNDEWENSDEDEEYEESEEFGYDDDDGDEPNIDQL